MYGRPRGSRAGSLRTKLRGVGEIYRDSEEELAAIGGRQRERVSGTRSVAMPLDDKMLSLRSRIGGLLSSWACLVIEERSFPALPGNDIPELLRFLDDQVTWLAEHPAAPDLDVELAALLESSRLSLGPQARRVPLGVCGRRDCTALLHALLSSTGDLGSAQVACDDGHAVPPGEWLLLCGRTHDATDHDGPGGSG